MAIIVYDGFDHYGAQQDFQARSGALQWDDVQAGAVSFVSGRSGYGYALAVASSIFETNQVGCSFNQNLASGTCGIASKALLGLQYIDYCLMDYINNVQQLTLRFFMNSGVIMAWAGNPNVPNTPPTTAVFLGCTAPNAFSPFTWNSVEIMATIGASGSFTVAVNGASVFSLTNVQTQAPLAQIVAPGTPNAFFNGFRIAPGPNSNSVSEVLLLDDFRLTNPTNGPGSFPLNGLIGDVSVRTSFPISNYSVQWTPLTGENWQEVGETQFDGDTSYNSATGVGTEDLFNLGPIPGGTPTVYATQITGGYRKRDAGAQTIQQSIVSAGTAAAGANNVMSVDYTYYTDLFVLDPSTGNSWTVTAVDALIAGYAKTA